MSSTPAGLITFVSRGYGGRVSDSDIVRDSGFLDVAPEGCSVLADRGFKCLGSHGIDFIVPPTKPKNRLFSADEVQRTRQIACLRIHIERVIERLREFSILKNRVNTNLLTVLDQVVIVAAALTNLQTSLIKV